MNDAIYDIAETIEYVLRGGHDYGSGVCYYNDVFEMHGFWSHENCDCGWYEDAEKDCRVGHPEALFHHYATGFKYDWYKRIGRSSEETGTHLKTLDFYKMVVECIESIRDDENPEWRCKLSKKGKSR